MKVISHKIKKCYRVVVKSEVWWVELYVYYLGGNIMIVGGAYLYDKFYTDYYRIECEENRLYLNNEEIEKEACESYKSVKKEPKNQGTYILGSLEITIVFL